MTHVGLVYFSPWDEVSNLTIGGRKIAVTPLDMDIQDLLGKGAYGTVHRMIHKDSRTVMAVKVSCVFCSFLNSGFIVCRFMVLLCIIIGNSMFAYVHLLICTILFITLLMRVNGSVKKWVASF